jgi:urease gamma subunit
VTEVRLFVADTPTGDWSELTDGDQRTMRVAASDLQHARRVRERIRARGEDVAVILDVTVAVAGDFRSARSVLGSTEHTVHYAGTVDGLAGLISDIARADVADGVTLISASPRQDLRDLGRDVLHRLSLREEPRAS